MGTVAIDILADCAQAAQTPVYFLDDADLGTLDTANERFLSLARPAFEAAATRLGIDLVLTEDAGLINACRDAWADRDEYRAAWQAVHDAVDVDLARVARQAVAETSRHAYQPTGVPSWRTCAVCGHGANSAIHKA
jgi:hypothetical protein